MKIRYVFMGIGLMFFLASMIAFTYLHTNSSQPEYIPMAVDIPYTYSENTDEHYTEIYVPVNTHYPEDIAERPPQNPIIPSTESLDAFFSQFGTNIGIYYKNLDTGFAYSFNPGRVFFGASINKITHGFYTYTAAERGYIDMYAVHTFHGSDFWGGSGVIRFMDAGREFTTRELLYYSIVHSDNIAFRMLARYMNNISFTYLDFVAEIGANPGFVLDSYSTSNTSAEDGMLWLYAIHNYLESESRYGHYFHVDLHNTAIYSHPYFTRGQIFGGSELVNVQFLHSDYPVAQKFGWSCMAFNVAGIVDAPSPFILIVFSNMVGGAHELFEEISWLIQGFNDKYFAGLAN